MSYKMMMKLKADMIFFLKKWKVFSLLLMHDILPKNYWFGLLTKWSFGIHPLIENILRACCKSYDNYPKSSDPLEFSSG